MYPQYSILEFNKYRKHDNYVSLEKQDDQLFQNIVKINEHI